VQLHRLVLHNFRNVMDASLECHPAFNIFHGKNAQGKTNVLEAIYILFALKSFRGARNADLIRWECEEAMIRAVSQRRETTRDLRMNIKPRAKHVSIDDKRTRSMSEVFGHLSIVLFSPEDMVISKGSGSHRRTFLDRAIFHATPGFHEVIRRYETALKNRNSLLKDSRSGGASPVMLDVFDVQLVEAGSRYIHERLRFIGKLRPFMEEAHERLVSGEHSIQMAYESTLPVEEGMSLEAIREIMEERVVQERSRDLARGFTSSGPHVDDLQLSIDERPARLHASQGQHRSLVLALKIAEISLLESLLDMRPILLLDDVSSELDRTRNAQLMEYLLESNGQVFITTTDPDYIAIDREKSIFHVNEGVLRMEDGT
jgi:DNA replication and repair protein RecF